MLLRAINSILYPKISNINAINETVLLQYKSKYDSGYEEMISSINETISHYDVQICLGNCIHEYIKIKTPQTYQILEHSDNLKYICESLNVRFKPEYRSHMKNGSIDWLSYGSGVAVVGATVVATASICPSCIIS